MLGGGDAGEERAGFEADAGAGWVEDDEVGAVAIEDGAAEEVECGGLVDGAVLRAEFGEGGAEVGDGGGVGFDGGDLGEAAGEDAGEEADAGEEIPGEGAGAGLVGVVADEFDEGFEEEAVDLEEAAAGDPVGFVERRDS